jgi:hypothetical protein
MFEVQIVRKELASFICVGRFVVMASDTETDDMGRSSARLTSVPLFKGEKLKFSIIGFEGSQLSANRNIALKR